MYILPVIGNPHYGYIQPSDWVDDHSLTQENKGSWDIRTHELSLLRTSSFTFLPGIKIQNSATAAEFTQENQPVD